MQCRWKERKRKKELTYPYLAVRAPRLQKLSPNLDSRFAPRLHFIVLDPMRSHLLPAAAHDLVQHRPACAASSVSSPRRPPACRRQRPPAATWAPHPPVPVAVRFPSTWDAPSPCSQRSSCSRLVSGPSDASSLSSSSSLPAKPASYEAPILHRTTVSVSRYVSDTSIHRYSSDTVSVKYQKIRAEK
jgi:hypothetical protein